MRGKLSSGLQLNFPSQCCKCSRTIIFQNKLISVRMGRLTIYPLPHRALLPCFHTILSFHNALFSKLTSYLLQRWTLC